MIKYRDGGLGFVPQRRRDDAYRQMCRACSGKYNILRQDIGTENHTVTINEDGSSTVSDVEYVYITFECAAVEGAGNGQR